LDFEKDSTVEVTGLREGGDVRGYLLAAIMILDLCSQDAYISTICITPRHVPLKWSATCPLAEVHVGCTKRGSKEFGGHQQAD
jgi:hypothetical protein